MPLQSRANGGLAHALEDPMAAASVSFGSGLLILGVAALAVPSMRRGVQSIVPAVRTRRIPWFYLLAGLVGAYTVFSQSTAVPMTGIALFTVAIVGGQTVSGLLVDHWGLGPAGRSRITAARVLGVVLMLVAVALSMAGKGAGGPSAALWLLLPLSTGFLMGFQQAANGHSARAYGSPMAATFVNFASGFAALALLWLALHLGQAFPALRGEWWMYLGGVCGCVYIGVNTWLLKHLGILGTAMGTITGQLLGSLLLDLVAPLPGAHVGPAAVVGLLLTFAAMAVMNIRRKKR